MKSLVIGAAISGPAVNLFRILALRWQGHAAHLSDPYRPERYYMRGPGPKWRAKHGLL
jgi:hypothetical protein